MSPDSVMMNYQLPARDAYDTELVTEILKDQASTIDMASIFLGRCIGTGDTRWVFNYRFDDNYVVKYEKPGTFHNVIEFEIWEEIKSNKKLSKWFAPVCDLSHCGRFLIMQKTTKPLRWPKKIPKCMVDVHTGNFGMIGNKFVCHDYAGLTILNVPDAHELQEVDFRVI